MLYYNKNTIKNCGKPRKILISFGSRGTAHMNPRQKELFKNIVLEYIKTAQPVGSKLLVDKYKMDISPATVRNDMVTLEDEGLIVSPHTSAGRIPTEFGYRKFIEEYVDLKKELDKPEKEEILKNVETRELAPHKDESIKQLAKILAEKSDGGVFIGFGDHDIYYTGLSNIFSQPEFHDMDLISDMSNLFDHLDEMISDIFDDFSEQAKIMIGDQEILPNDCSMVVSRNKDMLFGIIGPTRMDYQKNIELINFIKSIL